MSQENKEKYVLLTIIKHDQDYCTRTVIERYKIPNFMYNHYSSTYFQYLNYQYDEIEATITDYCRIVTYVDEELVTDINIPY